MGPLTTSATVRGKTVRSNRKGGKRASGDTITLADRGIRRCNRSSRAAWMILATLLAASLCAMATSRAVQATPPGDRITLPDDLTPDQLAIPDNPEAFQAIKQTLQGDEDVRTADPVLQDVLRMLGRKTHRRDLPEALADSDDTSWRSAANDPVKTNTTPDQQSNDRWRAAELLLKTSRILNRIAPANENRRQLVNRMRKEAVRILTQADPQTSNLPKDQAISFPLSSPDE